MALGTWIYEKTTAAAAGPATATWGLYNCSQGTDVSPHYIVRQAGTPFECLANARSAPSGSDLILDILRSNDEGGTWASIFPAGNANKINIPVGDTGLVAVTVFATGTTFAPDDLFRMDVLAEDSAEDATGVQIVLRWSA